MSEKTVAFVLATVARFPGLGSSLDAHRHHNRGEILPHVFFGEVTRYVVELAEGDDRTELQAILDHLDATFVSGDDELTTLISVSFLENVPRDGEGSARLWHMMGLHLKRELQAIG